MKRPRECPASLVADEKSNATKTFLAVNAHHHFMVQWTTAYHRKKNDPNTNLADCTYSEPVHKKRKMASDEKIELLENRIKAMEASAHSGLAPRAATDLPNTNLISPGLQTRNQGTSEVSSSIARDMPLAADPYAKIYHSVEKGDLEFQGYSADRTFIQGFKHELGDWAYDSAHKRLPTLFSVPGLFDTSRKSPVDVILPPRDVAKRLVEAALDAQILFSVIHRPSFNNLFNLIYSLDQSHYSTQEWRFLALFYAVLAYGSLFVDLCEDQEHDALSQAYFSPRKGFYTWISDSATGLFITRRAYNSRTSLIVKILYPFRLSCSRFFSFSQLLEFSLATPMQALHYRWLYEWDSIDPS